MKSNVTLNKYVCECFVAVNIILSQQRATGKEAKDRHRARERENERLLWHASYGNNFVSFSFFFLLCHRFLIGAAIIGTLLARASLKVYKMCVVRVLNVYCSSSIRFHSLLCRFCVSTRSLLSLVPLRGLSHIHCVCKQQQRRLQPTQKREEKKQKWNVKSR